MSVSRSLPVPQVRAAGAVCWRLAPGLPTGTRPTPASMQFLMVRSARWGNWSWPKGKLEPGEAAPVAAVREVAEETGVRPRLGLPLPSLQYVIGDGRLKQVDFWVGHLEPRRVRRPTAGREEIAEVAWVSPQEAIGRLEWPAEAAPAEHLLRLASVGALQTRALLVVRHAKARKRSDWSGSEATRPLTGLGRAQAAGLAPLLDCWWPRRVLSSPWNRCLASVRPYARKAGRQVEQVPELSEKGARQDPETLRHLISGLVDAGGDALVCTHRPVLADVVTTLRWSASGRARTGLPRADPWLQPAEVLVAHLRPGGGEVVLVERARPGRTVVHLTDA
ncbi:NUDIX domain-containing protein [Spongisporangium articulatum]|uniref:NUDIX domain-containing protein n=1 Tax=Spongisporangium articulatum TaxID=3362603 RepID=A0ABW8AJP1_9ACTN